jgi:hypothetical protein
MSSSSHLTRVLCAAHPQGSDAAIERLLETAEDRDAQVIVVVGDLGGESGVRSVLRALGRSGRPAYWVPGPGDAPAADYLREAYNAEIAFPLVHGVHGTIAFAPSDLLVAGFGGAVQDDPNAPRDEVERLSYPRWEATYRLKVLRELAEHQLILLFATHPAHRGHGTPGSEAVAELVETFRPRLVVCGGERGVELIGRSLVVAPGSLADGHCAMADPLGQGAELLEMAAA